jgi:hypothetical protein
VAGWGSSGGGSRVNRARSERARNMIYDNMPDGR